jgi:hypothetical protein
MLKQAQAIDIIIPFMEGLCKKKAFIKPVKHVNKYFTYRNIVKILENFVVGIAKIKNNMKDLFLIAKDVVKNATHLLQEGNPGNAFAQLNVENQKECRKKNGEIKANWLRSKNEVFHLPVQLRIIYSNLKKKNVRSVDLTNMIFV